MARFSGRVIIVAAMVVCMRVGSAADIPRVAAPAMEKPENVATQALGVVDDAFGCPRLDVLLVRRGNELYTVTTVAGSEKSKIVDGIKIGDRRWVLLESEDGPCRAILSGKYIWTEPGVKQLVDLQVTTMRLPGG